MNGLLTTPITIKTATAGAADAFGKPTETWATSATEYGRLVSFSGREIVDGKNIAIAQYKVILPAASTLTAKKRMVIDSETYEVIGPVYKVRGSSDIHHVEAIVRVIR